MIGRYLGVYTDIKRNTRACLSLHIYIYTRNASTLHTLHLITLSDTPFLQACRSFSFLNPCEYRARADSYYMYTHDSRSDANFYT